MNPTIRRLAAPVAVATASLLQGCAAVIPYAIAAAAADPKGTVDLAKDMGGKVKSALTTADAASAPAAAAAAPAVAAKAGITAVKACPAPATSAAGQAAQGQSPAAKAAAAKLLGGNRQAAQATQLLGAASDAAALAKNAAGAIDGSCVTITVGKSVRTKEGKLVLLPAQQTVLSFNLAAPNCTTGNIAGNALSSLKGVFSNDAKAEAATREAACATDKATIQTELDTAGKKASAAYRSQYKVPATARVDYTIQSNTIDLSSALQNAATGAVMPQIQQGAQNAGANAINGFVRELTKK